MIVFVCINQHLKFASTVSKCQGFCRGISMVFIITLGKKTVEVIEFLRTMENCFLRVKKYLFCLKRKRNVLLNEKVIFVFHMIFKLDFMTQLFTVLSTDVCILFSYFCYSLIPVSKKRDMERILILPISASGKISTK